MDILEKLELILNEDNRMFDLRVEYSKNQVKNKEDELVIGTIRTVPENYWVATILEGNKIKWDSWEANTKNIDKKYVEDWFKNYFGFI